MKKNVLMLTRVILLLFVGVICINMGGGETNTVPKPYHTELEDSEKSYVATVYEDGRGTKVKELNFAGKTSIEGVQQENKQLNMVVEFKNTSELDIVDPSYFAKGKEFALVNRQPVKGSMESNLLFPKNLIVSGVRAEDNTKVYWQVHAIKKIVIDHQATSVETSGRIKGRR